MSNFLRIAVLMGLLHGLAAAPAAAQDWAGKMFEIVEHDYRIAAHDERISDVTPNEASSTSHK